ncbi:toxin-antitoxin system HicB family antitoxin [Actinophytocola sp. NPDC049390]|uniref:toxin-antitoxin system HicB family antitoxin n=1 Tax=Actinophytocola sp. NPDC049390 TaxID=3363894 RepID=UPI0037B6D9F9
MDLTPFVHTVRQELAVAAEAGGEEARALADRLTAPLASAIRLTLLDALSAAAEEITRDLAPGSVEVRLRAGEAAFAVTLPETDQPADIGYAPPTPEPEEPGVDHDSADSADGTQVRINLRLPENLKARIEEAAAEEGRSVNAWLVRAATAALRPATRPAPPSSGGSRRGGKHFTGWVS